MKKTKPIKSLAATIIAVMITSYSFSQWNTNGTNIYNNNLGNVGFSTTGNFTNPSYLIDCKGDINLNGGTNIIRIGKKLRPVTYQVDMNKLDAFLNKNISQKKDSLGNLIHPPTNSTSSNISCVHTGFVAQEVEQAAKDCGFKFDAVHVPTDTSTDNYTIAYASFVVPLVKAVQEQQKMIDSLFTIINAAKGQRTNNNSNSEQGNAGTIHDIDLASGNAIIYQNAPNPFGDGTTIRYFIPDNVSNAQIIFFDAYGNQIKEFKVEEKGMGQLNVSTLNLAAGVYSYSLLVNGKAIDTKKMLKAN